MKKFISMLLSLTIASCLAFCLVGCNDKTNSGGTRVMTASLNPEVEFVLDAEDKVVTVNAKNDEGNYIIAKAEFVGMSAEQAVSAFLQISVEDGFLLQGEVKAGENNFTLSVSGEDAQAFYDKVKSSAEQFIADLETTVEVNFEFEPITKEQLEALVSDCMRELGVDELKEKTQAQLIELLEQSRKATEDLLSQELKDCYYEERALEIRKARLEAYLAAIKENDGLGLATALITSVEAHINNLTDLITSYAETFKKQFLDTTSEYYVKMQEVLAAKKEVLEARLEGVEEEVLTALESAYTAATSVLETCKNAAMEQVEIAYSTAIKLLDTITSSIENIIETLSLTISDIDTILTDAQQAAQESFDRAFKEVNSAYIENNYWANLAPDKQ